MIGTKLFLDKAKLIEIIALEFGINKHDVHQNKRNSLKAVGEKAFDDCHKLMRRIAYFVCHAEEKYARCNCDECASLIKVLSAYGARCLSLYDFVTKQNFHSSTHQSIVNMAVLDFFILQILKRVVSELKAKFESNRILFYLNEYIGFLITEDFSSKHPLKSFLKKHTTSLRCKENKKLRQYGIAVDTSKYRIGDYQTWSNLVEHVESYLGDKFNAGGAIRIETFGWHCAGNIIYRLFKLAHLSGQINAPWRESKSIMSSISRDVDFIYDSFLSLNNDLRFDLLRRNEIKFNLLVNNIVEFHLFISKEGFSKYALGGGESRIDMSLGEDLICKPVFASSEIDGPRFDLPFNRRSGFNFPLSKETQSTSSHNEHVPLTVSFRDNSQYNLNVNKEAQFNLSLIRDSTRKDDSPYISDLSLEKDLSQSDNVGINLFFDDDMQLNLSIDKNARFNLFPNKKTKSLLFENVREYRYKEMRNIINAFAVAISSRLTSIEVEGVNNFCKEVLNGIITVDGIKKEERRLRVLLKNRGSNRYTSLIAWCIFIAKCKLGKFKDGKPIQYCESKIAEYQSDYITWSVGNAKGKLKNRAPYADFKYDMLCRLGYMRTYNGLVIGGFERPRLFPVEQFLIDIFPMSKRSINWFPTDYPNMLSLLKESKYDGDVINPFVEIESYIDSLLRWDDCTSFKINIDGSSINRARKAMDKSLSWLITHNSAKALQNSKAKMKLCIMCAVRLYPELMALVGLAPSRKYTWLKARQLDELLHRLGPCMCQEINKLEVETRKNPKAEGPSALYYKNPISI